MPKTIAPGPKATLQIKSQSKEELRNLQNTDIHGEERETPIHIHWRQMKTRTVIVSLVGDFFLDIFSLPDSEHTFMFNTDSKEVVKFHQPWSDSWLVPPK